MKTMGILNTSWSYIQRLIFKKKEEIIQRGVKQRYNLGFKNM